jgi:hypothetical protein
VLHAQFPIDDLGYVGDGDVEYHEAHMSRHSNSFLVHACASYEIVPEVCLCPRYLVLRKLWRLVGVHCLLRLFDRSIAMAVRGSDWPDTKQGHT